MDRSPFSYFHGLCQSPFLKPQLLAQRVYIQPGSNMPEEYTVDDRAIWDQQGRRAAFHNAFLACPRDIVAIKVSYPIILSFSSHGGHIIASQITINNY